MQTNKRIIHRFFSLAILIILVGISIVFATVIREEVKTSKYQAQYLSEISKQLSFKLEPGRSSSIRYPDHGPYDLRLGYAMLPDMIQRVEKEGFSISAQAASSPMLTQLVDYGLFPIYREKTQAGLRIVDQANQVLFSAVYPTYGYPNFESIPPLVLNTLLFIENRELLDETNTTINPAVEWDRLGFAGLQLMAKKLGADINVPGGSTLATQLEKYRHSPDGYTKSLIDKFRQMGSASVRAYLLGPDTREMRREIALAYLNSMPLSRDAEIGRSPWFG